MTNADDLRRSVDALKGMYDTLTDSLGDVSVNLGKVSGALTDLLGKIADLALPDEPGPEPDVTFAGDAVTEDSIKVVWTAGDDDEVHGWRVGRDGFDTKGTGAWSTVLPANVGFIVFNSLKPNATYNLTLEPVLASGLGSPLKLTITTKAPVVVTPPDGGGGGGGGGGGNDHGPVALANHWVERARDDFSGNAVDPAKWGMYNSVGHGGKGLRRPSQFSIVSDPTALDGRCLRVQGTANGTTGGMAHQTSQRFGRWGVRMRAPRGDRHYHPVLLTWPSAENWPTGGEIDFSEGNASSDHVQFFLHYSAANHQTSDDTTVDTTKWHWWEMEWTPDHVRGWCDGNLFFEDTDKSHFNYSGFGAHHGTIQLDWFPDSGQATTGTAEMYVDAYRVYSA